jgi:valyl-tRNA synthetase
MVEHGVARRSLLALSEWPRLDGLRDESVSREIGWVIRLVSEVRSIRTEMSVPAAAKIPLVIVGASDAARNYARDHEDAIKRLARLDTVTFAKSAPKGVALVVAGDTTAAIPLEGLIDIGAERARLQKEIGAAEADIAKMNAKLDNPNFVAKAKPEAIQEARDRKAELEAAILRWSAALKRLEG